MSTARTIRLLCTGDLHLGRYPTRVDTNVPELTVRHVWDRIIDYAITQKMDGLVLTGDVVDEGNKFFESFGPLRTGLSRLAEADIPSFAVSGNHDFDVLPSLYESLDEDSFHLLGRGGRWETRPLLIDGKPVLDLCGWSFPKSHVSSSPLEEFEYSPSTGNDALPVLGLLHADLEQRDSRYAPVTLSDLRAKPVSAWALGHIHKPGQWSHRSGMILYPGSPQPLKTGETGVHGPWVVEISPSGSVNCSQIPLASVRYAECEVGLEGLSEDTDFRQTVIESVQREVENLNDEQPGLERVVITLRYSGRTDLHSSIPQLDETVRQDIPVGTITAHVAGSSIETRPDLDVERLAAGSDPVGVLSRLILDLDEGGSESRSNGLVEELLQKIAEIDRRNAYSVLHEQSEEYRDVDRDGARAILRDQALLLLESMVRQKSGGKT